MKHRIHFTRREEHSTLQSHILVPVSMNGRSGFLFSVEPTRSKTIVSARTIETLGISVDEPSSTVSVSENLVYPIVRLASIAVATATLDNFEVVVWGRPMIPPDILANIAQEAGRVADHDEDRLHFLGYHPTSVVDSVMECRGVLGADFLRNFRVSLDLRTDTLVLER